MKRRPPFAPSLLLAAVEPTPAPPAPPPFDPDEGMMALPPMGPSIGIGVPSGGAPVGFNPGSSLSNNVLWLRADLGITLNGADVSAWADQGPQGNDAAQSTEADQPLFVAGGLAGRDSVHFALADTTSMDITSFAQDTASSYTAFCVYDLKSVATNQWALSAQSGAVGFELCNASTPAAAVYDGAHREVPSGEIGTGEQVATWVVNAAALEIEFYRNAVRMGGQVYDGTLDLSAGTHLTLGGYGVSDIQHADAEIAEIIVYDRVLTVAEIAEVHAYLDARYDLNFNDPTDVANSIHWVRGDLGVTLNGADVSAWADQSTAGLMSVAQTTESKQPLYVEDGVSGLPAVDFTAGQQHVLATTDGADPGEDVTAFLAFHPDNATNDLYYCSGNSCVFMGINTGVHAGFDSTAYRLATDAASAVPTVAASIWDSSGTAITFRKNGLADGSDTYDASIAWDGIALGALKTVGGYSDGLIAEAALYDGIVSDPDVRLIERYMVTRYWAPTMIPDCIQWLRADKGITLNGADVSVWADQSGVDNDMVMATASIQPLFTASNSNFNDHPTVDGLGAERLDSNDAAATWNNLHDGTGSTLVLVYRVTVNGGRYFDTATGLPANAGMSLRFLTTGSGRTVAKEDVAAWLVSVSEAHVLDTTYIEIIRHEDSETIEVGTRIDGDHLATDAYHADGPTVNDCEGLSLLSTASGSGWCVGEIAEVIIYDRYLTSAELADLEAYLQARYNQ